MPLRNVHVWKHDPCWARNRRRNADVLFQVPGLLSWDCFICVLSLMVIIFMPEPLWAEPTTSCWSESEPREPRESWSKAMKRRLWVFTSITELCDLHMLRWKFWGRAGWDPGPIQCDCPLLYWMHWVRVIGYRDFWGCQCWIITVIVMVKMSSLGISALLVHAGAGQWAGEIKFWKEKSANCRVIVFWWSYVCHCMTAEHKYRWTNLTVYLAQLNQKPSQCRQKS